MNIELTDELMIELVKLKMISTENNFEDFAVAVKVAAKKLNLNADTILKMLYSEEFLHKVVVKKTSRIDREIKEKEEEIIRLKGNKYSYGTLLCNLYGHKPVKSMDNDTCYCENCGRRVNMSSLQAEHDKGIQNRKVYEAEKDGNNKRR